jgi:Protein of unknown function (DUF1569)
MSTLARDRDTQEIVRRIRTLRPDTVPRWGRMSAHQVVCHLSDAFRMAIGEKPVSGTASLRQRTVIKWIALHIPLRWPPGIMTVPEIDQEIAGTCPTDFAMDLAELEKLVDIMARRRAATWPTHPIFGRLTQAEWLRWGYLHTDHHLRQFGL